MYFFIWRPVSNWEVLVVKNVPRQRSTWGQFHDKNRALQLCLKGLSWERDFDTRFEEVGKLLLSFWGNERKTIKRFLTVGRWKITGASLKNITSQKRSNQINERDEQMFIKKVLGELDYPCVDWAPVLKAVDKLVFFLKGVDDANQGFGTNNCFEILKCYCSQKNYAPMCCFCLITVIFHTNDNFMIQWLECSPMARETWVQSQVESYQKLKKWYSMPPCLTLSIVRYGSRVKWSNPGKGVAPLPYTLV